MLQKCVESRRAPEQRLRRTVLYAAGRCDKSNAVAARFCNICVDTSRALGYQ